MSVLFNHACRYEFFERNPIRLVRQSAKRKAAPNVLTPGELKTLMEGLDLREKTLVLLAAFTGLRQSEMFGLKWRDIDFDLKTINVTRSIVYGVVGQCKTEGSQKPVPAHPLLLETLAVWRQRQPYKRPDDWVFASRRHRGRKPIWGQAILRKFQQARLNNSTSSLASPMTQSDVQALFASAFDAIEANMDDFAPPNNVRILSSCGRESTTLEAKPWPTCERPLPHKSREHQTTHER
jgi:site-specific recombinase XerC